jgi:GGDEF domain-containing protein
VGVATASFLLFCLALWLGGPHRRMRSVVSGLLLGTLVPGWAVSANLALWWAEATVCLACLIGVGQCVLAVRAGDHLARVMVAATVCMTTAAAAMAAMAVEPAAPHSGVFHAVAAMASIGFLTLTVIALWLRYAHVLEFRTAMRRGPHYDPLTRMSSALDTVMALETVLQKARKSGSVTGVLTVSIANLRALERLHGAVAVNHALFEFAARLRRVAGSGDTLGRFDLNKFILVVERLRDPRVLQRRALALRRELARVTAIELNELVPHGSAADLVWTAQFGIGLQVLAPGQTDPLPVLQTSRALTATALGCHSRIALVDDLSGEVREFVPSVS